jgi:hypothetical protein
LVLGACTVVGGWLDRDSRALAELGCLVLPSELITTLFDQRDL